VTRRTQSEFSKTPVKSLRRNFPKSFEGFCLCAKPQVNTTLTWNRNALAMLSFPNLTTVVTA